MGKTVRQNIKKIKEGVKKYSGTEALKILYFGYSAQSVLKIGSPLDLRFYYI